MLHRFLPLAVVWQHATAPPRPHAERAAQRTIPPRQAERRLCCWTASFSAAATQLTYSPWFCADAQSHCDCTAARAASTCAASFGSVPHAAARTSGGLHPRDNIDTVSRTGRPRIGERIDSPLLFGARGCFGITRSRRR
jgi:hypothetical protein